MWIEHGATKFLIYQHSISKEVDGIIRLYENDLTVEIERIPWSDMPVERSTSNEENPNKLLNSDVKFFQESRKNFFAEN